MTAPVPPIVVGVDGSDAAIEAVRWAARRAAGTGAALRLVHADATPVLVPAAPFLAVSPRVQQVYADAAGELLAEAARVARAEADVPSVTTSSASGGAAYILIEASERAGLVVVGSRGHGGFTELLLGSVSAQVSAYASCPVAVVRGRRAPGGPVLVGVDGSPAASAALRFGAAEAVRAGLPLLAICAWALPRPTGLGEAFAAALSGGQELDVQAAAARRTLAAAVRSLAAEFPRLQVHEQVVEKTAAAALIEASAGASLVVVGSRGHGGFAGLLLGSTSHQVLHHAACPVVVAHAPRTRA